jgi:molybdopterin synthase sulfur carrier subunit
MKLQVRYFAALRERVGRAEETVDVPDSTATVSDLRRALIARGEPWSSAFAETRRVRAAVDQAMAGDAPLRSVENRSFLPSPGWILYPHAHFVCCARGVSQPPWGGRRQLDGCRVQREELTSARRSRNCARTRASVRSQASSASCATSTTMRRSLR